MYYKWLCDHLIKGVVEANAHITTGGTSSDFVKGDGSLDSNSYALDSEFQNHGLQEVTDINNVTDNPLITDEASFIRLGSGYDLEANFIGNDLGHNAVWSSNWFDDPEDNFTFKVPLFTQTISAFTGEFTISKIALNNYAKVRLVFYQDAALNKAVRIHSDDTNITENLRVRFAKDGTYYYLIFDFNNNLNGNLRINLDKVYLTGDAYTKDVLEGITTERNFDTTGLTLSNFIIYNELSAENYKVNGTTVIDSNQNATFTGTLLAGVLNSSGHRIGSLNIDYISGGNPILLSEGTDINIGANVSLYNNAILRTSTTSTLGQRIATGRIGTDISFYTTPSSASTLVERMRIKDGGGIDIPTYTQHRISRLLINNIGGSPTFESNDSNSNLIFRDYLSFYDEGIGIKALPTKSDDLEFLHEVGGTGNVGFAFKNKDSNGNLKTRFRIGGSGFDTAPIYMYGDLDLEGNLYINGDLDITGDIDASTAEAVFDQIIVNAIDTPDDGNSQLWGTVIDKGDLDGNNTWSGSNIFNNSFSVSGNAVFTGANWSRITGTNQLDIYGNEFEFRNLLGSERNSITNNFANSRMEFKTWDGSQRTPKLTLYQGDNSTPANFTAAQFDGRVQGEDAVNDKEFVTKQQLDAITVVTTTQTLDWQSITNEGGFEQQAFSFAEAETTDHILVKPQSFEYGVIYRAACYSNGTIIVRREYMGKNGTDTAPAITGKDYYFKLIK